MSATVASSKRLTQLRAADAEIDGNIVVGGTLQGANFHASTAVTRVGASAGDSNQGTFQTVLGNYAGADNSGNYQTALGVNAGRYNQGDTQTAVGTFAGYNNSGSNQAVVGYGAGINNSGVAQTAVGYGAGGLNTGTYQTVVGYQAGNTNSGDNLVAIGYQAGYSNALDNQFIVKHSLASATPLIQGNFQSGSIGIGIALPEANLHVAGNIWASGSSGHITASGDIRASGTITANSFVGNLTGNAATVTTNAILTGHITSTGNVTSLGSFSSTNLASALTDTTGTGANVFAASPTFTGAPLSTTPATADNTTKIATTAFVKAQGYITSTASETNDLTSAVTWANVPNANITQGSVTQHQAALSITESQISDLGTYSTATGVENNADVTNATNVAAAGAVMNTGNETIAGNKTFSDKIINSRADDLYYVNSANTLYTPYTTNQWHSAGPFGTEWHDTQAFNRNYTTTQYTSTDGSTFSSATLETGIFANQDKTAYTVIASGVRAVRFQFYGVAYNTARYFQISSTYSSPTPTCSVLIETSADGTTWSTIHTSTGVTFSASSRYYWCDGYVGNGGHQYVRVTIDKGNTDTKIVRLSSLRILTQRAGDQGKGREDEFPYTWDKDKNIGVQGNLSVTGTITGTTLTGTSLDINGNADISGALTLGTALADAEIASAATWNAKASTDYVDTAESDAVATAASANKAWSTITGTPTTISGYGITDALEIGVTSTTAMAGNTTIPAAEQYTQHESINQATTNLNNSGRTYIQDITLDSNGHVTAVGVATETVTDTTYAITDGQLSQNNLTNALKTSYDGAVTHAATSHAPSGATVNSADATLLARANHTGTQTADTISDFDTEVANNSAVTANTAKPTLIDEDDMASNSATQAPSQQSVKAYVDNVSVPNLKIALASGFAGNAVTIGDGNDTTTMAAATVTTNLTAAYISTNQSKIGWRDLDWEGNTGGLPADAQGDIIYHTASTATTAGSIYYMQSNGNIALADANALASSTTLLMVALGVNASKGLLLRGMIRLATNPGASPGTPIYLSGTAGRATGTAPSATGDVVRILGYQLTNTSASVHACYFNPDNTWVELT